MADNKVKFLRGTSNEYAAAEKDSDTIYFTTNDGKLYIGDKEVLGDGSITIDTTLSDTSENPVQNKVVKQAIDSKADKSLYSDTTINVGRLADSTVGNYSIAEGQNTTASGNYSHAEGYNTIASGIGSHAEGSNYFLSGVPSSRKVTISNGKESTIYTIGGSYAYGINSHAEGTRSFAYGSSSHAEGQDTTASGAYSHAEGRDTTASGTYSHAEGDFITASGAFSHAEGNNTTASGNCSHAEGCCTTAGGRYSHAGGYYTKALKVAEFAHGQYNQSNNNTLFSIGDGTADNARHNAFEITTTGGKLHDKDIATTDLIPTTLPANGGNADTVDGMHASDFMPINGEVRKYGLIRMNGSDGIRVRHIDGNDTEADGALYLNYNSPNATIYMNGANVAIHSGNIGSQSVNYATNAGNANTVGGISNGYYLGTLNANGGGHGGEFQLSCQHNVFGDNRFVLQIANRTHEVRVDYATNADTLDGLHASDIITSSKPYVTGEFTFTLGAINNGNERVTIQLGFMPSYVGVMMGDDGYMSYTIEITTSGFFATFSSSHDYNEVVRYIAFR